MTDTVVNIHVGEKTVLKILQDGGHVDTAQEVISALEAIAKVQRPGTVASRAQRKPAQPDYQAMVEKARAYLASESIVADPWRALQRLETILEV